MFKWAETKISETKITSPSGKIVLIFRLHNGAPYYKVLLNGTEIIARSKLGFNLCGVKNYNSRQRILDISTSTHTETIELPWGETQYIDNTYNELTVKLTKYTLIFRVFDNVVALCYQLNPMKNIKRVSVAEELTEFNVSPNATTWSIPAYELDRYEYNYRKQPIQALTKSVHTPLTIKSGSTFLAIHEAALYDYGSMTLKLNHHGHLQADITPLSDGTKAHLNLPFKSPWRLVMLGESALELTTNYTMYALNQAPRGDFSWVKPLKFMGIWWAMYVGEYTWAPGPRHGATTKHARAYIDAAAKLGIKGLLIEGWNDGWEGDWLKNGQTTNFTSPMADFDLPAVARYAESRGIELVGHHETVGFVDNYTSQLERAYNYYAANHINYIKTGYSGSKMLIHGRYEYHHSQLGVNHYQKTVELAAKKHICLDIHEPIKGTGIERTFPNLLTREGARGQEYEGGALPISHACTLPFTRMLAGGMDYTCGILDVDNPTKHPNTTIVRQLAYFITFASGMVMAADRPAIYQKYQDLAEFIKNVPVNFERTVPLAGEIEKYYIVARKNRSNNQWFIGGITDEHARNFELKLDFLPPNTTFVAKLYQDAKNANFMTNRSAYEIAEKTVNSSDILKVCLAPGGGVAIHLRPLS